MCKEKVYVPTLEGLILNATKILGQQSFIFQLHRMATNAISHKMTELTELHCIAGGIVTAFKATDGKGYKITMEVVDE